jgi:prepilin-type N-terminal cleavage/methylation domain-containing protein
MKKFLKKYFKTSQSGVTLIELLLVMGIISILFTISSILLLNLIPKASQTTHAEVLISELRHQQLKAMVGETQGTGAPQAYGVYIASDRYVLFGGEAYDSNDPTNFVVVLEGQLQLSTNFANQQIVFLAGSGEVKDFDIGNNRLTLSGGPSGQTVIMEVNRYGVVYEIN